MRGEGGGLEGFGKQSAGCRTRFEPLAGWWGSATRGKWASPVAHLRFRCLFRFSFVVSRVGGHPTWGFPKIRPRLRILEDSWGFFRAWDGLSSDLMAFPLHLSMKFWFWLESTSNSFNIVSVIWRDSCLSNDHSLMNGNDTLIVAFIHPLSINISFLSSIKIEFNQIWWKLQTVD